MRVLTAWDAYDTPTEVNGADLVEFAMRFRDDEEPRLKTLSKIVGELLDRLPEGERIAACGLNGVLVLVGGAEGSIPDGARNLG